jgi:hypothetical protein
MNNKQPDWANKLLTSRKALDWAKSGVQASDADPDQCCVQYEHFLDYTCVASLPFTTLSTRANLSLNSVTFSFAGWNTSYSSKHAWGLDYSLRNRTFRLALTPRVVWYLVFEPISRDQLHGETLNIKKDAMNRSAIEVERAIELVEYICDVFQDASLISCGVEKSWTLGGAEKKELNHNNWRIFQDLLFRGWDQGLREPGSARFWLEHQPTLHAYDFGQNVKIMPNIPHGNAGQTIYRNSLDRLATVLNDCYDLDSVATFSCAIATNIRISSNGRPVSLLADRNLMNDEFMDEKDYYFYPLGFSPYMGNFQAASPPSFLKDQVFDNIQREFETENSDGRVFRAGSYQGYSEIKTVIRHGPRDFLPTKGLWQAALGVDSDLVDSKVKSQRNKIAEKLLPEMNNKRPIFREAKQIGEAIRAENHGFRMEAILDFDIRELLPHNRTFKHIIDLAIGPTMRYWIDHREDDYPWMFMFNPKVCFPPFTYMPIIK